MSQTLAFLNNIGPTEILLVLALVLLLFGGRKLPELARGLGRGMREFKEELRGVKDDVKREIDQEPAAKTPSDQKKDGPSA